jgi:hypothetical protein
MNAAYSVFADGLSQPPVFASPLDRGRFFNQGMKDEFLSQLQGSAYR